MSADSEGRPAMDGKSFLNHISIGGFNLGEALDPNNNLDKLGNAVQSGDIGGIIDVAGDMLDDLEDRYDQASDLLQDLIAAGKKDKQVRLGRYPGASHPHAPDTAADGGVAETHRQRAAP